MKPIVIYTTCLKNISGANIQQADHLILSKHERVTVALAYGSQIFYLDHQAVKELIGFCTKALEIESVKTFEIPSDPASLAKAENPIRKESDGSFEDYC
jgi:hypothetical protein